MGVFKKQGVYWIDYYLSGHRKRERIGPDKRLTETGARSCSRGVTQAVWMCDTHLTQTELRQIIDKLKFVMSVTLVTQNSLLLLMAYVSSPLTTVAK